MTLRRLVERQVAEGEEARDAALIASLRFGKLEKVEIDFRHPDLPPDWEPLPWWYVWGPTPSNSGLMFPSEAKAGGKELRDEAAGAVVYVRPGDKVSVESVEVVGADSQFRNPHDEKVRLAHLRVERSTGEVVSAGPLAFFGAGRLMGHGTREAFDHMIDRVLRHNGLADFPTAPISAEPLWEQSSECVALSMARQAHDHGLRLLDLLPPDGSDEPQRQRSQLRFALNGAALAGYLLGRLESREATDRATGQVLRAKRAAAGRKDQALIAKAKELEAAHPRWTRHRLAKELHSDFPNKELSAIQRTLKRERIGPEPA